MVFAVLRVVYIFGMPKQAIELSAVKYVMSLTEVADTLKNGIGT